VLKAYDTITIGRLEFDVTHLDIAQSLISIRKAIMTSGNRPTCKTSRSEEVSHGDLAWVTMHALANEPLQGQAAHTQNIVEIY